ncbi:IS3 family transposase [Paenibacillus sp. Soil522]|uniref:IS3 family transposase n=1 Tax=Paenibacillus sp. Soil522 TaxID=1736388 RepID=UPI0006F777FE|nr:hypothetical protein ASG81_07130 [Paenibacillus sp. Soil522]
MVERDCDAITIKRQAELLGVNRTSVYRADKERHESEENVQIMHLIDEIYTLHPYFGYRRMTRFLRDQGFDVNRKRVRRLMRLIGLEAIYPKPNLSKRLHAQYKRPYLLRGLKIDRPNYVQFCNQIRPHQSLNGASQINSMLTRLTKSHPKMLNYTRRRT